VRGKKYQPHDVERAAEVAHPALRPGRAAAFQADDASGPDALVLAVEVVDADAPAADLAAAIAAARAAVADAFGVRPDRVALLKPGALFKTSSGKLQRFACKAAYLDGSLAVVAAG
jgi:nonribosomal peptide synthetase protein BlmVI